MGKRLITAIFLIAVILSSFGPIVAVLAASPVVYTPQVSLPGGPTGQITGSSIGDYIKAVFQYGVAIIGILAAVMITVGGFLYITAFGSQEKITKAKDYIYSSLAGLVLLLTSVLILNEINPDLVTFTSITPEEVPPSGLATATKDTTGASCPAQTTKENCEKIHECFWSRNNNGPCIANPSTTGATGVGQPCTNEGKAGFYQLNNGKTICMPCGIAGEGCSFNETFTRCCSGLRCNTDENPDTCR